jgi:hypothetical protein
MEVGVVMQQAKGACEVNRNAFAALVLAACNGLFAVVAAIRFDGGFPNSLIASLLCVLAIASWRDKQ